MLQKQRNTYDCCLASLASAVGKSYEELWPTEFQQEIERLLGTHGDNVEKAFEMAGMKKGVDYWVYHTSPYTGLTPAVLAQMLKGRRAMLQVPSLNTPAPAQHMVYFTGEVLHDPSNKQCYNHITQLNPQYVWIFNEMKQG
jgi:hypothetical protein